MANKGNRRKIFNWGLTRPLKNQRGVSIMIAVAALMMIMYFATEISYESNVEYLVNSQSLNRVKAYYAAKSGMQLSLLRVKMYQEAQAKLGAQLGNSPLLDQLWKFPFAWPMPIPDELSAIDKDNFKKTFSESTMDASYIVTIDDEGSKIDINDLNSPAKSLQEATKQQLLNIFEQKKLEDQNFAREYGNFRFEELINNIGDWMSSKAQSLNGGDKRSRFSELNQLSGTDYYPPNRAFRSIAELHMVPGMNDDFFDLLAPRVTIYGMKGINPNLASKEVLKSLDAGLTDEIVAEIIKRRESENEGGPFKCDQNGGSSDFWNFAQTRGARLMGDPSQIPLTCESIVSFRIQSTGEFAGAVREITAIVLDLDKTATKVKSLVDKEKSNDESGDGGGGGNNNNNNNNSNNSNNNQTAQVPKGPPRIVYWNER
ncbi:general secretory pathway protein K [Bdellovibrio bacteriovorus W]|nr:general secretory pathway protein K [Bdellovibrio bacteriovorus W]